MVMGKRVPFELTYADALHSHLAVIEVKYHSWIMSAIEAQLAYEPDVETRNRKPLKRPIVSGADWELRTGPDNRFRVFYEIDRENRVVRILAFGVKDHARLTIGDEEFIG